MNNLVNGIIILVVITALTLSIISLVLLKRKKCTIDTDCATGKKCLNGKCINKNPKWRCENKNAVDSTGTLTSCSCIKDEVNGTYQTEQECKSSCCYTCNYNNGSCTTSSTGTISHAACKLACVDPKTVTVLPFSNPLESQMENGQTQCNLNFDRNCDRKATPWGDASGFACKSNYCRDEVSVRECDKEKCNKVTKETDCPGYTPTGGWPINTNCEWISGKCTAKAYNFGVCSECKRDSDCDPLEASGTKCKNGVCINETKTKKCFISGSNYNFNDFVSLEVQNACYNLWNSNIGDPCSSKKLVEECHKTRGESKCISEDGRDLGTMSWGCTTDYT